MRCNDDARIVADEKTYEVRVCNLPRCPRSFFDVSPVAKRMVDIIEKSRVPESVVSRVNGPILKHHRLNVSISGCPNSCSQPQIADFGVQGRARPVVGLGECNGCGACVSACTERAVSVSGNEPAFDTTRCIDCGDCVKVCPTEAIVTGEYGFSVLVGGKLGRHPQLARTLFDFANEQTLLAAFKIVCEMFAEKLQPGERFANAVDRIGVQKIARRIKSA